MLFYISHYAIPLAPKVVSAVCILSGDVIFHLNKTPPFHKGGVYQQYECRTVVQKLPDQGSNLEPSG